MMEARQKHLQRLLYLLVLLLSFEGVTRKILGGGAGVFLFFGKDVLVGYMFLYLLWCGSDYPSRWINRAWLFIAGAFLVPIAVTAIHDPVLAVFGAKQYLLFPTVAVATVAAFAKAQYSHLIRFCRQTAFLLIPTAVVAVLQTRLPSSHWINLSVDGGSLKGFSAGGQLRVSSTFSFVAQYCMFLNAQMAFAACALVYSRRAKWIYLLLPVFIVSTFITGSRTAVLGNAVIAVAAAVALAMAGRGRGLLWLIGIGSVGLCCLALLQQLMPEHFAAYSARVSGTTASSHTAEVTERIAGMLFGWLPTRRGLFEQVFGTGLGIMSNGADHLSAYAARWRDGGYWTETDLATTVFEGGYYLVFMWMAFRLWIVVQCWRLFSTLREPRAVVAGAVCIGYIAVMGVTGPLGIQPPLACWWWLGVGILTSLATLEYEGRVMRRQMGEASHRQYERSTREGLGSER